MATYTCQTGSDAFGDPVYAQIDSEAPGQYAGRTLQCNLGRVDAFGDPVYEDFTFTEPEPEEPAEPEEPEPEATPGVDVAAFLGGGDDPALVALADEHLPIITAMARAYTRGAGFDEAGTPNDEIAAVVTAACARLVANPEQIPYDVGGVSIRGGFTGWTLAETFTLNGYRRRAA